MTYDSRVYDLCEVFMPDATPDALDEFACYLQQIIESYVSYREAKKEIADATTD